MASATSFIDFLFEPPWVYILMVGGTIFGVWFLLKKYGMLPTSAQHFKGETLNQIIQDQNINKFMKTFGDKVKKGKLTTNLKTIKVSRVASVPAKINIRKEIKVGRFKKKKYIFTEQKKRFLIFKTGGGIFESVPLLNYMHKKPEYFVVDDEKEYVRKDPTNNLWTLNSNTFAHTFGGVWIFSADGVAFLTELAYKKMQENDKEESVNALKRFIFYNDQHTGRIVSMERRQELKDESWEKSKKAID